MSFYGDLATTASQLIAEFGAPAILTKKLPSIYDATNGSVQMFTAQYTGKALIFDRGSKDIDGTNIIQGDKKMILSIENMSVPNINDAITFNGITYTVVLSAVISPAGTDVVYILNVR